MAEIPSEIKRKIEIFVNELQNNNYQLERLYLFGSYAKGTANEWSDIDVALISQNFVGNRFLDREKLRKINSKVGYSISLFPYRPEDFIEEDLFVKEIITTGIRLV